MTASVQTPEKKPYRFFAFISYSSKDLKWGRRLQRMLEHYRLPARLWKKKEGTPPRAYPIFRDETDLSGFKVRRSLERELEDSRYLIVICTPQSAKSTWVNDEIRYFIDHGREDRILPFIAEGIPYSGDPETECFPPALREMAEHPLGVDVQALGRRRAYLRLVSTLLNVEYDQLVMRDRYRRILSGSAVGLAGAVLAAALGWAVWYNTPHSKYYNAVVYRNEIPEGLGAEMTPEERQTASDSYCITTQRGQVIRLEPVNSLGATANTIFTTAITQYPVQEFRYDGNGQLIAVDYLQANRQPVSRKLLTYNPSGQIAVEFQLPGDNTQAQALISDLSYQGIASPGSSNSEITRQLNTYDENGWLVRVDYQRDNLGTPGCDSNGVYGKRYEYDALGQVLRITNLDQEGNAFNCRSGWATIAYTYDEWGNCVLEEYLDAEGNRVRSGNGVSAYRLTYDKQGNLLRIEHLDEQNALCGDKNGIAQMLIEYDGRGLPSCSRVLDAQGLPTYDTASVHEYRYGYDDRGRNISVSFFDEDGQSAYSQEYYCYAYRMTLDQDGRVLEWWQYDGDGKLMPEKTSGACGLRYEYDEYGYVSQLRYLDAAASPTMTKYGYASVLSTYDASGNILRQEYRDEKDAPVRSKNNFAIAEFTYNPFGNQERVSLYDENGEPCYHVDGHSRMDYAYENSNLVSVKFYDIHGEPTLLDDNYHGYRMDYENGRCIRISYFDTTEALINCSEKYAVKEQIYDRYGNVLEVAWYDKYMVPTTAPYNYRTIYQRDARGNPVRAEYITYSDYALTYYSMQVEYDVYSNAVCEFYFDKSGEPVTQESGWYAQTRNAYDSRGNLLRSEHWNEQGLPYCHEEPTFANGVEYAYDAYGNQILYRRLHINADGTEICIDQYRDTYDAAGNNILAENLDGNGNLIPGEDGFAVCKKTFNTTGDIITQEYFGPDGQPCLYQDRAARHEYTFSPIGEVLENRRYGLDGQLLSPESGHSAIIRYDYNARGQCIRATHYDRNGQLFGGGENGAAILEYTYDEFGRYNATIQYDTQGNILYQEASCIILYEINEGSQSQKAGLLPYDILLQYGSWHFFAPSEDIYNALGNELEATRETEKEIVIARWQEDGTYLFRRILFGEGFIGARIVDSQVDAALIDQLEADYAQWLEKGN